MVWFDRSRISCGFFYYIKLLSIYGIASVFLEAEGIDPPLAPKCIARITTFSELHRTIDRGLYGFMLQ